MYPSWSPKCRYIPGVMTCWKCELNNRILCLFLDIQSVLFAGAGGAVMLDFGVVLFFFFFVR